jgi:hypothetical protein
MALGGCVAAEELEGAGERRRQRGRRRLDSVLAELPGLLEWSEEKEKATAEQRSSSKG